MAKTTPKTLYLIDGFSQIFRAYYAPAAFRNRGQAAGAAFIFTRMLMRLLQKGKPDAIVCAWDGHGSETSRTAIYPEYKAHRDPMPEDLREQLPTIRDITEGMGIPVIEGGDWEADDVIGTLATKAAAEGWQVRIISRDKDLKQLLSDRVFIYDIEDGSLYGPDELEVDLGLKPAQVIDYLALMGDTSDGIPGAYGVGPKKAQALLQEYGSLAAVMERAEEIKQPKLQENLVAHRKIWRMSYQLATVNTGLKLDFATAFAAYSAPSREKLLPILQKMTFRSIITDLGWGDALPPEEPAASKAPAANPADKDANADDESTDDSAAAKPTASSPSSGGRRISRTKKADVAGSMFAGMTSSATAEPAKAALPAHLATLGESDADGDGSLAPDVAALLPNEPKRGRYFLASTPESLAHLAAELAKQKQFAFDTETTGLETHSADLVGMSFASRAGEGWYVPVRGPEGSTINTLAAALKALGPILENPAIGKIGQNIKFDMLVMMRHGVTLRGVAFDTMIAAYLADSTRTQIGLDTLAQEELGYTCIPITLLIGADKKKQITMDRVPLGLITQYAGEDADIALRVAEKLTAKLEDAGLGPLSRDLEMPLVEALAHMEREGIRIDLPYLAELSKDFEARIADAEKKCHAAAGRPFTVNSPKQLGEILYDELMLQVQGKTSKGARSTDQSALESLTQDHPLPALVLEYRQLAKLKSTYIDALPLLADSNARVHTSFRQAVVTGRLSSTDPNVQNIPVRSEEGRKIRKAFVAAPGNALVVADYSQIEPRIVAHLSGDPTMKKTFADGKDIHRIVAAEVNGVAEKDVTKEMREHAKAVNFGILYGQSAHSLGIGLGIPRADAQAYIEKYFARFPRVRELIGSAHEAAQRDGFVTTIMGRQRQIPGLQDRNRSIQAAALRQAFNTVIQGSAADLIKTAMVRIHRKIRDEGHPWRMLIQVHDELLFEAPAGRVETCRSFVKSEMEGAMKLDVPLTVDIGIGPNWLEAKR